MASGLLRDSDWAPLDGAICRVTTFSTEIGFAKGVPYATIELERLEVDVDQPEAFAEPVDPFRVVLGAPADVPIHGERPRRSRVISTDWLVSGKEDGEVAVAA